MLKNVPDDRKLALALGVAFAQMIRSGWTCISWQTRSVLNQKFCPAGTGVLLRLISDRILDDYDSSRIDIWSFQNLGTGNWDRGLSNFTVTIEFQL
jgi:hypothetical protein